VPVALTGPTVVFECEATDAAEVASALAARARGALGRAGGLAFEVHAAVAERLSSG
jgi:hypothetical protein